MTTAPVPPVAAASTSRSTGSLLKAQVCRLSPPVPSPLSGPGSGPVTNPSRDIVISATTLPMRTPRLVACPGPGMPPGCDEFRTGG